jgi:ELWxxDGT repeat protein
MLVKAMSQDQEGSGLFNLVNVNGTLFFTRPVRSAGVVVDELWKSDGTENGTVRVEALLSNVREAINLNGQLFFRAGADELWKSDGTESGTELANKLSLASGYFPWSFVIVGNDLFFSVHNSPHEWELRKTDGTTTGTILVKDITDDLLSGPGGSRRIMEERWHRIRYRSAQGIPK